MKKRLGLLLATAMVAGCMAGCRNTEAGTAEGENSAAVSTEETGSTATDDNTSANQYNGHDLSEKITLTFNVIDTEKQNMDARYDYLREKFNVDFNLISCSLNDCKEKARMWVSGGDMPDMMWSDIDNASELRSWIEGGALKELPDLSGYPNLAAFKDMQQTDDSLTVNGADYFITTIRDTEEINFLTTQAFIYRKDWAQQLGLYKEEYTWDEMLELAKAMVEQDPGANGAGKTIGVAGVGWAYPGFSGLQQISPNWNAFYQKDGAYVWGAEQPETLEGLKMAKKMYTENMVWSEQSLANTLDGPAKFQAGQAGILYHNLTYNNIVSIISGLKETYPGEDVLEKIAIMNVKSPDGTNFALEATDAWGSLCFRYDIGDAELERFLCILDWLASEEGIMLQQYGVEGIDYQLNNGEIEMLWEKDDNGNYVCPYEVNSDRILSFARLFEFEKGMVEYATSESKEIMEQLKTYLTGSNMNISKIDYAYLAFSAPNKDQSNLSSETREKMIELIISSDDIEADYADWLASQTEKKDAVLKELNEELLNQ